MGADGLRLAHGQAVTQVEVETKLSTHFEASIAKNFPDSESNPEHYYRHALQTSSDCACPPCGKPVSGKESAAAWAWSHNGYWSFMGSPGAFCEAGKSKKDDKGSFTSIANSPLLYGKRVLLFGDSVTAQMLFAMLCDLRRSGLLRNETLQARAATVTHQGHRGSDAWPHVGAFYDSVSSKSINRWDTGLVVPTLGLNLTWYHPIQAAARFCTERERDLGALRTKIGGVAFAKRGVMIGEPCPAFWDAAVRDYDVIFANPLGIGLPLPRVANFSRAMLQPLQAAAEANRSKAFFVLPNTAQHFNRMGRTGLYEDDDASSRNDTHRRCYCSPIARNATDPRNVGLVDLLREEAPAVHLFNVHALTRPMWFMHVARTTPEHTSNGSPRASPFVCDCTHYCYLPDFWRRLFFPALHHALVEADAGASASWQLVALARGLLG